MTRLRRSLLPLFVGVSLFIGLLVPSIYELSQKPEARSDNRGLERMAIVVAFFTVAACVCFALRKQQPGQPASILVLPTQFRLRHLFIAMTLAAILFALPPLLSPAIASALVIVVVVAIMAWGLRGNGQRKTQTLIILASMFLPFTWVFAFNRPIGHASGLIEVLPLCPGIFFAELSRMALDMSRDETAQLAIVFVFLQLLIAVWLVRRGGKLPVIYASVVLLASSFSSIVIHALYRM